MADDPYAGPPDQAATADTPLTPPVIEPNRPQTLEGIIKRPTGPGDRLNIPTDEIQIPELTDYKREREPPRRFERPGRESFMGVAVGELRLSTFGQMMLKTLESFVPPEEGYDGLAPEELRGYESIAKALALSKSRQQSEMIKERYRSNNEIREIVQEDGGFWSSVVAMVANPENLIPIPMLKGIGFLRGAGIGAVANAGVTYGSGLVHSAFDPYHDIHEDIAAAKYSAIFGGFIGGAVGRYGMKTRSAEGLALRYLRESQMTDRALGEIPPERPGAEAPPARLDLQVVEGGAGEARPVPEGGAATTTLQPEGRAPFQVGRELPDWVEPANEARPRFGVVEGGRVAEVRTDIDPNLKGREEVRTHNAAGEEVRFIGPDHPEAKALEARMQGRMAELRIELAPAGARAPEPETPAPREVVGAAPPMVAEGQGGVTLPPVIKQGVERFKAEPTDGKYGIAAAWGLDKLIGGMTPLLRLTNTGIRSVVTLAHSIGGEYGFLLTQNLRGIATPSSALFRSKQATAMAIDANARIEEAWNRYLGHGDGLNVGGLNVTATLEQGMDVARKASMGLLDKRQKSTLDEFQTWLFRSHRADGVTAHPDAPAEMRPFLNEVLPHVRQFFDHLLEEQVQAGVFARGEAYRRQVQDKLERFRNFDEEIKTLVAIPPEQRTPTQRNTLDWLRRAQMRNLDDLIVTDIRVITQTDDKMATIIDEIMARGAEKVRKAEDTIGAMEAQIATYWEAKVAMRDRLAQMEETRGLTPKQKKFFDDLNFQLRRYDEIMAEGRERLAAAKVATDEPRSELLSPEQTAELRAAYELHIPKEVQLSDIDWESPASSLHWTIEQLANNAYRGGAISRESRNALLDTIKKQGVLLEQQPLMTSPEDDLLRAELDEMREVIREHMPPEAQSVFDQVNWEAAFESREKLVDLLEKTLDALDGMGMIDDAMRTTLKEGIDRRLPELRRKLGWVQNEDGSWRYVGDTRPLDTGEVVPFKSEPLTPDEQAQLRQVVEQHIPKEFILDEIDWSAPRYNLHQTIQGMAAHAYTAGWIDEEGDAAVRAIIEKQTPKDVEGRSAVEMFREAFGLDVQPAEPQTPRHLREYPPGNEQFRDVSDEDLNKQLIALYQEDLRRLADEVRLVDKIPYSAADRAELQSRLELIQDEQVHRDARQQHEWRAQEFSQMTHEEVLEELDLLEKELQGPIDPGESRPHPDIETDIAAVQLELFFRGIDDTSAVGRGEPANRNFTLSSNPGYQGQIHHQITDNQHGGSISFTEQPGGYLQVNVTSLDPKLHGQGIGLSMYMMLVKLAERKGVPLRSDTSVSGYAQRVWESLKRRGYDVELSPDAKNLPYGSSPDVPPTKVGDEYVYELRPTKESIAKAQKADVGPDVDYQSPEMRSRMERMVTSEMPPAAANEPVVPEAPAAAPPPAPEAPAERFTVEQGSRPESFLVTDKEGSVMGLTVTSDGVQVGISTVPDKLKGQGIGTQMYAKAMAFAHERGLPLRSDFSVSADAVRVWEGMKKRGHDVHKHPDASTLSSGAVVGPSTEWAFEVRPPKKVDISAMGDSPYVGTTAQEALLRSLRETVGEGGISWAQRALMDEFLNKLMRGDIDAPTSPKDDPNYLPHIWLRDKVAEDPYRLRDILAGHYRSLNMENPEAVAMHQVQAILLTMDPKDIEAMPKGMGKFMAYNIARTINVPTDLIWEFVETDVGKIMRDYAHTAGISIEFAKQFGDRWANTAIEDTMIQTAREGVSAGKLANIHNDIMFLRDSSLGILRGGSPLTLHHVGVETAKNWAAVAKLGGVAITAMQEAVGTIATRGFVDTFGFLFNHYLGNRAMVSAMNQRIRNINAEGWDVAMGMHNARYTEFGDMNNMRPGSYWAQKAKQIVDPLNNFAQSHFFIMNGLAHTTYFLKDFTMSMASHHLIEDIRAVSRGTASAKTVTNLAGYGIEKPLADLIMSMPLEKTNGLNIANMGHWNATSPEGARAVAAFVNAVTGEVRRTIVSPGQGDKSMWQQGFTGRKRADGTWEEVPVMTLPFQFLSWSIAATQKVAMSRLQGRDANAFGGTLMSVGMAYMLLSLRTDDRTWEKMSMYDRIFNSVEKSGVMGMISDINNRIESGTRGTFGARPLLGLEPYGGIKLDPGVAQWGAGGVVPGMARQLYELHANPYLTRQQQGSIVRRSLLLNNTLGFEQMFKGVQELAWNP